MKFNQFRFVIPFFAIILLNSCVGKNDPIEYSDDASFVSLTLAGNDSVKTAVFTLSGKTIENVDSLPFNTRVDKVRPTFSFKSISVTKGTKIIFPSGDTVSLTGKDTLNFSVQPLRVINYAGNTTSSNDYTLKINVHKVEPELYVWKSLGESLEFQNALHQKTITRNDSLFYFFNDGISAFVSTSKNGMSWKKTSLSNFPVNTSLEDMTLFNGMFYVTQDLNNIYSSSDGLNWVKKAVSEFNFKSLLFDFKSKLWAVVQLNNLTYRFATSSDGKIWEVRAGDLPVNFPMRGFASISMTTRTGKPKVLVLGGYNASDVYVKSNWSSEDGIYWVNFSSNESVGKHSLDSLAPGASILSYDNKLLLFGAVEKNGQMIANYYRQSVDEGMSWQVPNKTYNQIRFGTTTKVPSTERDTIIYTNAPIRSFQSTVIDNSHNIYIIGGKYNTSLLSEVWKGKLNRLSFLRQ
ncbi:MAG: hypothetical protein GZ091_03585 [Paludibacter sp.]|nr:hypothetical protein [Paludibacter sp.]